MQALHQGATLSQREQRLTRPSLPTREEAMDRAVLRRVSRYFAFGLAALLLAVVVALPHDTSRSGSPLASSRSSGDPEAVVLAAYHGTRGEIPEPEKKYDPTRDEGAPDGAGGSLGFDALVFFGLI